MKKFLLIASALAIGAYSLVAVAVVVALEKSAFSRGKKKG